LELANKIDVNTNDIQCKHTLEIKCAILSTSQKFHVSEVVKVVENNIINDF